jgi:hypothetical protein
MQAKVINATALRAAFHLAKQWRHHNAHKKHLLDFRNFARV